MSTRQKVERNAVKSRIDSVMAKLGLSKEMIKQLGDAAEKERLKLVKLDKIQESFKVKQDYELDVLINKLGAITLVSENEVDYENKRKYVTTLFGETLGNIVSLMANDGTQYERDVTHSNEVSKDATQYEFYRLSKQQIEDVTNGTIRAIAIIRNLARVYSEESAKEYNTEEREELFKLIDEDIILTEESGDAIKDTTPIKCETSDLKFDNFFGSEEKIVSLVEANSHHFSLDDLNRIVAKAEALELISVNDLKSLVLTVMNLHGVICSEGTFARICDNAYDRAMEIVKDTVIDVTDLNSIYNIGIPNIKLDGDNYAIITEVLNRVRKELMTTFHRAEGGILNSKVRKVAKNLDAVIARRFANQLVVSAIKGSQIGNDYIMTPYVTEDVVYRKAIIASIMFQLIMIKLMSDERVIDGMDIFAESFAEEFTYRLYDVIKDKIDDALAGIEVTESQEELDSYIKQFTVVQEVPTEKVEEASEVIDEKDMEDVEFRDKIVKGVLEEITAK